MSYGPRLNKSHSDWYVFIFLVHLFLPITLSAADSIAVENAKTGTTAWLITQLNVSIDSAQPGSPVDCTIQACFSQGPIEGYASAPSVNQGESISLYVKSDESYTIRIYRMGWYGGDGAKDYTPSNLSSARSANSQSSGRYCTSSAGYALYGLIECNWSDPYVLSVPTDWVSGVYLAKLTTQTSAKSKYIIFVVRDDARPSPYLFQLSVTTYQAYNIWGGTSLYANRSTTATASATDCSGGTCGSNGIKASFLRPYQGDYGTGQFLSYEINTLRFLEREGYDVTYVTDVDTHANPTLLFSHKAFLSVGHDEYWTWEMRSNVERARERGISLAFLGANSVYWRIRMEPSTLGTTVPNRTMVAFRGTTTTRWNGWADPSGYDVTTHWRSDVSGDPEPKPEQALLGVQFKPYPSHVCLSGDISITNTANWPPWLLASTGLTDSSVLPGLLGYETDVIDESTVNGVANASFIPAGTIKLADSLFPDPDYVTGGAASSIPAHMAYYHAASGAHVFSTGSIFWNWGLDDLHMIEGFGPPDCVGTGWQSPAEKSGAQQMMRNFLAEVVKPVSTTFNTRPVQWSDPTLSGVSVTNTAGNNLQKSATTYAWDSGTVSSQQLDSGEGYVEVTASENDLARGFGLSHVHSSNTFSDIQFGVQLKADGKLGYLEGTSYGDILVSSVAVTYAAGDRVRVAVVGGQVQYSKNGTVIRTISPTITYPLMVNAQFFSPQATLVDAVVSSEFSNVAQWTGFSLSGVTVTNNAGNNLQKSATTYDWDSGTVSSQQLDSGNGYVEVTATENDLARGFGLTHVHSTNTFSDIQFGMQLEADGKLGYLEGTSYGDILVSSATVPYAAGDRLRVAVVGGNVQYSKNGTVIRTISPTITYPLMADAQFFSPQATLKSAVVSPGFAKLVKWMGSSLTGVSVDNVIGNNVSKSAGTNAWDAGAVSVQEIESGNGYVELTVTETNKARGFGLSHVHGQNTYVDIQFGLELGADGNLYRFESGSYPALNQSYATGDRLRVAIVGSDVKYYKNGTLLHTLTAPTLSYPYMANAQFFNTVATLRNIVISSP